MNLGKFAAILTGSSLLVACDFATNPNESRAVSQRFTVDNALTASRDTLTCGGDIRVSPRTCTLQTRFGTISGESEIDFDWLYLNTKLGDSAIYALIDSGVTLQWAHWTIQEVSR